MSGDSRSATIGPNVAVSTGVVMTRTTAIALGLFLVGFTGSDDGATVSGQAGDGWTTLFDGKNLDHWTPIGNANWRLTDGTVEATSGTGFLVSKQSYGDFELRVEFWIAPEANSGIFIRCQNPKAVSPATCYEVNAWDQRPDPLYRTGAIVDVAKPMAMINAANRWNTYEISARGPRLVVRLNGTLTVDVEDTKLARGPVALQASMGTVRFRSVQIR